MTRTRIAGIVVVGVLTFLDIILFGLYMHLMNGDLLSLSPTLLFSLFAIIMGIYVAFNLHQVQLKSIDAQKSIEALEDAKELNDRVQDTLTKVFNGEITSLECPYCSSQPLRFSYAFVEPDNYGVWISCTNCGNEAHLRAKGRPPGYAEEYMLEEFQKRSEEAIRQITAWWDTVTKDSNRNA